MTVMRCLLVRSWWAFSLFLLTLLLLRADADGRVDGLRLVAGDPTLKGFLAVRLPFVKGAPQLVGVPTDEYGYRLVAKFTNFTSGFVTIKFPLFSRSRVCYDAGKGLYALR